jgi:alpha-methylacyl-CoA racemase
MVHDIATGPLRGLRVVELAALGPGPFAAMLLADLGAEVIRVDRPYDSGSGAIPPEIDATRRGRISVVLDLRRPEGARALLDVVAGSDVLIEGNRPGVTERLGIGPEDCWRRNPRLIYARMTGWGQDGPLASSAGHDLGYLALTGALHAMGRQGERPAVPLNLVGDYGGGALYLAVGILAAVFEAARSGRGQVVDAAIVDGAASLTTVFHAMMAADMWRDERGVNLLDSGVPWYDVYETADGRYVAVAAIEPKFYAEFMSILGLTPEEHRREDSAQWPALRSEIAAVIITRTRDEWAKVFEGTDACVAPVLSLLEAPQHLHLASRGTFVDVGGLTQPAPAPRFSRSVTSVPQAPPKPGAHTRDALRRCGVDDVDALIRSGIAVQA